MTIQSFFAVVSAIRQAAAGSGAISTIQPPIIGELLERPQAAWNPHHLFDVASRSSHDAHIIAP
jgi:hypothetical protein